MSSSLCNRYKYSVHSEKAIRLFSIYCKRENTQKNSIVFIPFESINMFTNSKQDSKCEMEKKEETEKVEKEEVIDKFEYFIVV